MNLRNISAVLVAALAFASCKKDLEPQESSMPLTASATSETQPTPTAQPVAQPSIAQNAPAINPAHGQPGHRCDIAVGAPLTQTAGTTTQQVAPQPIQTQQVIQPQVQMQPPQKVAKGMNPAHGQPGHRCDIPVGTPLSQPVKSTTQKVTPQVVQSNGESGSKDAATITPVQISSDGKVVPGSAGNNVKVTTSNGPANGAPAILQTPSETKPGMNPAHGQPGHRCDIAVGAPLTDAKK